MLCGGTDHLYILLAQADCSAVAKKTRFARKVLERSTG